MNAANTHIASSTGKASLQLSDNGQIVLHAAEVALRWKYKQILNRSAVCCCCCWLSGCVAGDGGQHTAEPIRWRATTAARACHSDWTYAV